MELPHFAFWDCGIAFFGFYEIQGNRDQENYLGAGALVQMAVLYRGALVCVDFRNLGRNI